VPHLRDLGLDQNPSEHPTAYPGRLVEESVVFVDSWIYGLAAEPGSPVREWSVQADGGPLALTGTIGLDRVLTALQATPMAGRLPVVAVGSNAAPAQLAYKYRTLDLATVVPITRAFVANLEVAHSAHISKPGYVPFIPVRAKGDEQALLHVLWLDPDQMRRMDNTEPNYTRVTVAPTVATAVLTGAGSTLPSFDLYRGRWGALRSLRDGAPVRATSQAAIYTQLAALDWFLALVPELRTGVERAVFALARDAGRRESVKRTLAERGLVTGDDLPW